MKLRNIVLILTTLLAVVLAWDKEDYEIFDIVAELEANEGKGTTFYSFLNVSPTASNKDITKAYRSTMLANHPDKNPNNVALQDRHKRLTTIGSILRNKESRKRYDFWLKRGVPYWKGGAYLFSRFRPGLGTVLVFLTILSSTLQYLVKSLNFNKHSTRINDLRTRALIPNKHKVRIPLRDQFDSIFIDCVIEDDNVYILEPDSTLTEISDDMIERPSIKKLWPISLASFIIRPLTNLNKESNEGQNFHEIDENDQQNKDEDESNKNKSKSYNQTKSSNSRNNKRKGKKAQ